MGQWWRSKFWRWFNGRWEKCDRFGGFLSLMSVAGGTGSGVGTRITQCLKDRYPQALLMNQLVWPHCSGEVILQNYNAVLSLAHLYECADAINIIHNDHMRKICSSFSSTGSSNSGVSFTDMNKLIAEHMALLLQPSHHSGRSSTICDLMETLVSHPDYKLLTMYCVPQTSEASLPFSTFAWPGLMKRLHQMVINASSHGGRYILMFSLEFRFRFCLTLAQVYLRGLLNTYA